MNATWLRYADLHAGRGHTVTGDLRVLRDVGSEGIPPRDLLVWLPEGASESGLRYPVVYCHDGQNLFDAETSFAGEWELDETMVDLAAEGIDAIVVGIPNGGDRRFCEYTPFGAGVVPGRGATGDGAAHLRFVTDVVKPAVDRAFPTRQSAAATGILGSSLGGLMSAWCTWERPDLFGMAGAFSPALGFGQGRPLLSRLRRGPKPPARVYVDIGGAEGGSGSDGAHASARAVAAARQLRDACLEVGFRDGIDLRYVEDPGAPHHESAWARRLPDALRFLLADVRPLRGV